MSKKKDTIEPTFKVKVGAITAAAFENVVKGKGKEEDRVYYSTSVQRVYMDEDGEWQYTTSFREEDLPKLALAVNEIYKKIKMEDYSQD